VVRPVPRLSRPRRDAGGSAGLRARRRGRRQLQGRAVRSLAVACGRFEELKLTCRTGGRTPSRPCSARRAAEGGGSRGGGERGAQGGGRAVRCLDQRNCCWCCWRWWWCGAGHTKLHRSPHKPVESLKTPAHVVLGLLAAGPDHVQPVGHLPGLRDLLRRPLRRPPVERHALEKNLS
jgi:hypothetical protein